MDRADHGAVAGKVGHAIALQVVAFDVAGETFGTDIACVREITRVTNLARVPGSGPDVEGVMNLRGKIIPVVNLRRRLGMASAAPTESSRIIVAEIAEVRARAGTGRLTAFMVDRVHEVLRLTRAQVAPLPLLVACSIPPEFIAGVGTPQDRLIILLDLGKVFATPTSVAA